MKFGKFFLNIFIVCFLSILFLPLAKATSYGCVDPDLIQLEKDPSSDRVKWNFQFPMASKWEGFQTEPSKLTVKLLRPGVIRAIQLDYGINGDSWPIPRLTCFYLGDGKTTASGFIRTRFFSRPDSTPSIDDINYTKTAYCEPTNPEGCHLEVN